MRFLCIILTSIVIHTVSCDIYKDSINSDKYYKHFLSISAAKSQYFTSFAPNVYGKVQTLSANVKPAYSVSYELTRKLYRSFLLGIGASYTNAQFRLTYTNFVSPNILNGVIDKHIRHQYISFPLNLYYKISISQTSSMYLIGGFESFKSIKFGQINSDYVSIYKPDGSADNNYSIQSQFLSESFSPFRIFNIGMRFGFNEWSQNRLTLTFNYYTMNNYFPLELKSNLNIGGTNFEINNSIYFNGVKISLGYLW